MAGKTQAQKMFLRENYTVLLVNAPAGYLKSLGELPRGARILEKTGNPVDFIQVFAATAEEMNELLGRVKPLLREEGLLWATYPKAGQKNTDLKREVVWECARKVGMHPVAQVAVDEVWSALRLKKD